MVGVIRLKEKKKRKRDGRAGKKLQQTLSYREKKIKQQRLME